MKVDWKHFASTSGYKSLKASIDEHRKYRFMTPESHKRLTTDWKQIIAWVVYRANKIDIHPWELLDELELHRTCNFNSYYANVMNNEKNNRGGIKPRNIFKKKWHNFYKPTLKSKKSPPPWPVIKKNTVKRRKQRSL